MARVGVIVPSYRTDPQPLLDSIAGSDHDVCWYLFVHGQDAALRAKLDVFAAAARSRYFPYGVNRGLARSWNDGVKAAFDDGNDVTLIVNDDLFFYDGGFDQFVDFILTEKARQPDFGIAMTYGMEPQKQATHPGAALERVLSLGACFAIGEGALQKVGYFDENFWPAYLEDFDYHYRLGLAGVPLLCDERTLLQHQRSATVRRDRLLGLLHGQRLSRNEQYYRRKWGGAPDQETYLHPFGDDDLSCFIGEEQRHAPFGPRYDRHDLNSAASLGFLEQSFSEELLAVLCRFAGSARRCLEWGNGESTGVFAEYAKANGAEFLLSIDADGALRPMAPSIPMYPFLHFHQADNPGQEDAESWKTDANNYVCFPLTLGRQFDLVLIAGSWQSECLLTAASIVAADGIVIAHDEETARHQALRRLLREAGERGGESAAVLGAWGAARHQALRELYDVAGRHGRFLALRPRAPRAGAADAARR